jgi:hypothetical protein
MKEATHAITILRKCINNMSAPQSRFINNIIKNDGPNLRSDANLLNNALDTVMRLVHQAVFSATWVDDYG